MPGGGAPADVGWPDDAVEVGRVVGSWGVKGWFKVLPYAADPQALFASRRWYLKPPESSAAAIARPAPPPRLAIVQARSQGEGVVAQASEIADRDAAEALRGARVFVPRTSFPTVGRDEYYWVDLIGLAVVNREGESLGRVVDLMDTGVHSVLRVADPAGAAGDAAIERLIPFVATYVDEVDLPARTIRVDWGLDY